MQDKSAAGGEREGPAAAILDGAGPPAAPAAQLAAPRPARKRPHRSPGGAHRAAITAHIAQFLMTLLCLPSVWHQHRVIA